MSTQYNLEQKYRVNLEVEITIKNIVDHFPSLQGLVFDLLEDKSLIKEVIENNLNKIEGSYSCTDTSFDIVNIDINKTNILSIENK